MLEYYRDLSMASRLNDERLAEPPSPGRGGWRKRMRAADIERFEAIAGDLLETLGYERAYPRPSSCARARAAFDRAGSRTRLLSMRLVMPIFHRSPLWRFRQNNILRSRGLSSQTKATADR